MVTRGEQVAGRLGDDVGGNVLLVLVALPLQLETVWQQTFTGTCCEEIHM